MLYNRLLFILMALSITIIALLPEATRADEPISSAAPFPAVVPSLNSIQPARPASDSSNGPAPLLGGTPAESDAPAPVLPGGTQAYAFRWFSGGPYDINRFDLAAPQSLTTVGFVSRALFAGDFANDDFSALLMLDWNTNQYLRVSTTNAAISVLGTSNPAAGQTWSGMAWDRSTNTMYANSSNCAGANMLYRVNIADGALTPVAPVTGVGCLIDIAVSPSGTMYGVDINTDFLVQVDKNSGAGTLIGPIGFNANFAQDLDFDDGTGTLYHAAYNGALFRGELRTVNLSTGATTLVGIFGGGGNHELDGFGIASVGPTPTPTVTGTPPTSTPTNTPTNSPTPTVTRTPNAPLDTLSEGFNNINVLPAIGWSLINRSQPPGVNSWFQGNNTVFPAQSGSPAAYIAANFNSGATNSTISNWLITPVLNLENGDVLRFWTRCHDGWPPDRLQVRMSTSGGSTDVGTTATSVGDFTTLLLDINPMYGNNYPSAWTEYTITIGGLGGTTPGRLAFRYFVEGGGPGTNMSEYIGIDTVSYAGPATATPTSTATYTPTLTPTRTATAIVTNSPVPTLTSTVTSVPGSPTPTQTATSPAATATGIPATSTASPPMSTATTTTAPSTPTVTHTSTPASRALYLPLVQRGDD